MSLERKAVIVGRESALEEGSCASMLAAYSFVADVLEFGYKVVSVEDLLQVSHLALPYKDVDRYLRALKLELRESEIYKSQHF